jgi:hypothetical protein
MMGPMVSRQIPHMTPAGQPTSESDQPPNPGPSSPNEPGGIFTANLKGMELANRPTTTLAEVADATEQGIQRVCNSDSLVIGFLTHTGLNLNDPSP